MNEPRLLLSDSQVAMGREWCADCWPDESDAIAEATPLQIQTVISRRWDGGLNDFIKTNPDTSIPDGGLFGDY